MLNIFPILFLSMLAHAILRVMLGGALLALGYRHLLTQRRALSRSVRPVLRKCALPASIMLGVFEVVIGTLFVLGAWTQLAALGMIVYALCMLAFRGAFVGAPLPDRWFYAVALAAALSLLITGAGAFAFDLPI